jgi:hypothetical protein
LQDGNSRANIFMVRGLLTSLFRGMEV